MTSQEATKLSVVVSESDVEARELLDGAWDDLVRAQRRPNPTMLGGWLLAMLGSGHGELVVVRVESGRRLIAAAALSLYRPLGFAGPTLARWPGDPSMWFDCDVLVHPEHDAAGHTLVRAVLDRAHAFFVPCMSDGALSLALRDWDRRVLHRWPPAEGWVAPIPAPRGDHMRRCVAQDIRKAHRKGAENAVRIATSPADVASALDRMFALHHSYWKTRPDYLHRFSATEELRALNRSAVLALAQNGESFVVEVLEDGEPIAASLGLLAGHGLLAYASATRRGTILKEPGYAAQLAQIDHGASCGATVVDLGSGAGGRGTVKGRVGAIQIPIESTMCARSPAWLETCRSLVVTKDRAREVVRRVRQRSG